MTRTALITGGQQGIGWGIATELVRAGYRVALAAELTAVNFVVQAALVSLGPAAR